ncbi:hypothetical protein RUND412_011395, partial [Rhizina undulata]
FKLPLIERPFNPRVSIKEDLGPCQSPKTKKILWALLNFRVIKEGNMLEEVRKNATTLPNDLHTKPMTK